MSPHFDGCGPDLAGDMCCAKKHKADMGMLKVHQHRFFIG